MALLYSVILKVSLCFLSWDDRNLYLKSGNTFITKNITSIYFMKKVGGITLQLYKVCRITS